MDLAVTRAVVWSLWPAKSASMASKLNSPAACPPLGSSTFRPRSAAHPSSCESTSSMGPTPGTISRSIRRVPALAGVATRRSPCRGGDGGLGGDRDGAGRERAGVDLEWGGDLQLADPLDQADADRWAQPREDHRQQVRQLVWRRSLHADLGR